jgi:hypothetical protein
MKHTNLKAVSLTLLALAVHGSVQAGVFVDERSSQALTPAQISAVAANAPAGGATRGNGGIAAREAPLGKGRVMGRISGEFSEPAWQTPGPPAKSDGEWLSSVIMELRPRELPPVTIDAPDHLLDMKVTWRSAPTRVSALAQIASLYGINIAFSADGVVTIRETEPVVVGAGDPVSVASMPNAPAAGGQQAFEVRLTDIRLAASFERWAQQSGMRIRWDADRHLLIGAPMTFRGADAFDAISQALATPGIANSEYPLEVCQYPNTPPLLRITRQGEQARDCPAP